MVKDFKRVIVFIVKYFKLNESLLKIEDYGVKVLKFWLNVLSMLKFI